MSPNLRLRTAGAEIGRGPSMTLQAEMRRARRCSSRVNTSSTSSAKLTERLPRMLGEIRSIATPSGSGDAYRQRAAAFHQDLAAHGNVGRRIGAGPTRKASPKLRKRVLHTGARTLLGRARTSASRADSGGIDAFDESHHELQVVGADTAALDARRGPGWSRRRKRKLEQFRSRVRQLQSRTSAS